MNLTGVTTFYANQWGNIDGYHDFLELNPNEGRFRIVYACKVTDNPDIYIYTGIYNNDSMKKELRLTFTDIEQYGDKFSITPREIICPYVIYNDHIEFTTSPRSPFWRKWASTIYYFKQFTEEDIDQYYLIESDLIHSKTAIAQGS